MAERGFGIRRISARRVVLDGPSYWESFVGGEAPGRFLFKPGWRTVYASRVESAVVAVELDDGTVGWGEANAPIVPEVTCLLANRLLGPVLEGRDFAEPAAFWDLGYDIQRGRGHLAGFHLDALAMIDVAVWDASPGVPGCRWRRCSPKRRAPRSRPISPVSAGAGRTSGSPRRDAGRIRA